MRREMATPCKGSREIAFNTNKSRVPRKISTFFAHGVLLSKYDRSHPKVPKNFKLAHLGANGVPASVQHVAMSWVKSGFPIWTRWYITCRRRKFPLLAPVGG